MRAEDLVIPAHCGGLGARRAMLRVAALAAQRQFELELLADENAISVEHAAGSEVSPGINDRLLRAGRAEGFEEVPVGTFYDRTVVRFFRRFVSRANGELARGGAWESRRPG